jgi:hypothetical protein
MIGLRESFISLFGFEPKLWALAFIGVCWLPAVWVAIQFFFMTADPGQFTYDHRTVTGQVRMGHSKYGMGVGLSLPDGGGVGFNCEPFNLRKHRCFDQAFNNGMTEGELVTVDLARVRLIPFITTTTEAVLAIRAPGVTYMDCADRLRELGLPIKNVRMSEAARASCVRPAL